MIPRNQIIMGFNNNSELFSKTEIPAEDLHVPQCNIQDKYYNVNCHLVWVKSIFTVNIVSTQRKLSDWIKMYAILWACLQL